MIKFAGSRSSRSRWSSPRRTAVSSSARRRTGESEDFRNIHPPPPLGADPEAKMLIRLNESKRMKANNKMSGAWYPRKIS